MDNKKIKKDFYDDIIVALGSFILVPFILYFKTLFDGGVNVNFDGLYGYSIIDFYNKTLLGGEFPLWNKYVEGGVVMGSFHTIGLYPFALLFSFLSASMFSFVFYFFHLSLGAFFFFKFLKELDCDWHTAFAVALIYEMSTHIGGYRKEHFTIIIGIVYLPVILFFIQKYINREKSYWLVLAGIAMGFQFLGSHTQIVVYTDIAVFTYLLIYLIAKKKKLLSCLPHAITCGLVYIGTILGQLYITASAILGIGKTGGKTQSAIEDLKSWSIHYCKLFMAIFPKIFGEDDLMPLGNSYSSEMDIEIFLGFLVLLLVCFGIFKMRKYFEIRIAIIFMIGAFIYASLGHIPYLADIIAKIPILNGFRVPSRALFIFIFFEFVILAIVLNETKSKEKLKEILIFLKRMSGITIVSIIIFILIGIVTCTVHNSNSIENLRIINGIFKNTLAVCIFVLLFVLCGRYLIEKNTLKIGIVHILFCAIVVCVTGIETNQYAVRSYRNFGYLTQEPSAIENKLADGNYKTLSAWSQVGVQDSSFIAYNHSVNNKIQSINAYVTYNNMNIYKLFTGYGDVRLNNTDMFYVFPNMEQILRSRNSAMSVLGIKYIIDSCNILSEDPIYYENLNSGKVLYESKEDVFVIPFDISMQEMASLKKEQLYKIDFDVQSNADMSDFFYLDIYDLNGTDNVAVPITGESGHKTVFYYISDKYDIESLNLRITAEGTKKSTVSRFMITEVKKGDSEYSPYYDDGKTRIYINNNAKDILFSTDKVNAIVNGENIYSHLNNYDLLNTSYVTNYQRSSDKSLAIGTIRNVDFGTNSISAIVNCESDTFINFSQNYHSGWKAYIDGVETKVYMVDEAIMGIDVPEGEHIIKFVFKLPVFYICIIVSGLTIIFGVVYSCVGIYRDRR